MLEYYQGVKHFVQFSVIFDLGPASVAVSDVHSLIFTGARSEVCYKVSGMANHRRAPRVLHSMEAAWT